MKEARKFANIIRKQSEKVMEKTTDVETMLYYVRSLGICGYRILTV